MLTLYYAPGSSSMAPHIALHEIGEPFETRLISFANRDQHAAEYLALNPEGKVPTLLADEKPLTEVAAILYYLAKRFPAAGLWPSAGLEAEAEAVSWMSFLASTVHPARRTSNERWRRVFTIADRRLARREWVAGDSYSVADIHLFRLYWRFDTAVHPVPGSYPGIESHYQRMLARPAVRKTMEIEAAAGYELPL